MNEKIKQLAEQSQLWDRLNPNSFGICGHSSTENVWGEELQEFAEMIVRECAEVCRNQPDIFAMKLDRDNCAIAIEEHFGIEDEDEER